MNGVHSRGAKLPECHIYDLYLYKPSLGMKMKIFRCSRLFVAGLVGSLPLLLGSAGSYAESINIHGPAKVLFGHEKLPSQGPSQPIGFYSRGCMEGGLALPLTGPTWQIMRPLRNRNWGTTWLLAFIKRASARAAHSSGWPGLLIGDMAQPRGGPMLNMHGSHQIGMEADIWFTPMPHHVMSTHERETKQALNMVASNGLHVSSNWTNAQMQALRAVAVDPEVDRIFVNPAIKKAICETATGNRAWLNKIHPYYGHKSHFHVRLFCPRGAPACKPQAPYFKGEMCGKHLAYWFSPAVMHPKPNPHYRPRPPLTLAQLPAPCAALVRQP